MKEATLTLRVALPHDAPLSHFEALVRDAVESTPLQIVTLESVTHAKVEGSELEAKVRALIAHVAPPGSEDTPELRAKLRDAIVDLVAIELVDRYGMKPENARAFAAVMAATIRFSGKDKP